MQALTIPPAVKARGPLGEIELKPIKSTSKIANLYVVNPATGAKLQNPDDPQALDSAAAWRSWGTAPRLSRAGAVGAHPLPQGV